MAGMLIPAARRVPRAVLLAAAVPLLFVGMCAQAAENARGMVATVHPLATQAAVRALERGNAIDAAVAAALMLGVVDGHNSGLGGGCLILVRTADGEITAIDGRETAPFAASRDMFLKNGVLQPEWSRRGALACATPGEAAALHLAWKKYGRLPWRELVLPAAEVAAAGFEIDAPYADALAEVGDDLRRDPAANAVFFPSGRALQSGDVLVQADLARSLAKLADEGPRWFYEGEFAAAVEQTLAARGGVLTAADFAAYRALVRTPVRGTYRERTIVGFPPPSSGGVHVLQILNVLEQFDLAALHAADGSALPHVAAEAMKLAFADRARWLGDADFVGVPRGLVSKEYALRRAPLISLRQAMQPPMPGAPPQADAENFPPAARHTTHLCAADADGNWVALTATINTTFGARLMVPGFGVMLNNEMDDFSAEPGKPNAFGLTGGAANEIAPGKRPLSSMSPTFVLRGDEVELAVGAAGGPRIISQTAMAIVQHVDFGAAPEALVAAPRYHHQGAPNELLLDANVPQETAAALAARGHRLARTKAIAVLQAIAWDSGRRMFRGAHDPQVPGAAAGP